MNSLSASTTESAQNIMRVIGRRMTLYSAIRIGKGISDHRQPDIGLMPSSW